MLMTDVITEENTFNGLVSTLKDVTEKLDIMLHDQNINYATIKYSFESFANRIPRLQEECKLWEAKIEGLKEQHKQQMVFDKTKSEDIIRKAQEMRINAENLYETVKKIVTDVEKRQFMEAKEKVK